MPLSGRILHDKLESFVQNIEVWRLIERFYTFFNHFFCYQNIKSLNTNKKNVKKIFKTTCLI